jgi:hypothetical protein
LDNYYEYLSFESKKLISHFTSLARELFCCFLCKGRRCLTQTIRKSLPADQEEMKRENGKVRKTPMELNRTLRRKR